jgi:hypothetical protein
MIDENTRGNTKISDHEEYQDETEVEQPHSGYNASDEVPGGRPIYSIIKHYQTKWQIRLAKEADCE